jgi:hypothetical protein
MLETLHAALQPLYLQIKFLHVFFAMIWAFSTAVAYSYYVKGAFLKWERNPDDAQLVQRRNWAIEQFDKGAILEHVAFPVVMITGPLMYWLGPWSIEMTWLLVKLAIIALVFLPMEILDYWLAHFGGNKEMLRKRNLPEKYEASIRLHWKFLKVTTPLVMVFIPLLVWLAVTKPA